MTGIYLLLLSWEHLTFLITVTKTSHISNHCHRNTSHISLHCHRNISHISCYCHKDISHFSWLSQKYLTFFMTVIRVSHIPHVVFFIQFLLHRTSENKSISLLQQKQYILIFYLHFLYFILLKQLWISHHVKLILVRDHAVHRNVILCVIQTCMWMFIIWVTFGHAKC